MLVWAYHPKLRPVAVAVVAIAVVVAVEAVDKWESYSWCRASPAFAPTQPLPLSWAVSVLSRGLRDMTTSGPENLIRGYKTPIYTNKRISLPRDPKT